VLSQQVANTTVNLVLLVLIPGGAYALWHRLRHGRGLSEVCGRAGLRVGDTRYIGYSLLAAAAVAVGVWLFPPDLEVAAREGAVQHRFVGAGISIDAILTALLYALVQTGFSEEFLFRGLIAGSLARRLRPLAANLLQAAIFLAPHLLLLFIMPEHWPLLILIFVGALFAGWVRIESESIIGPWIIHGVANLAVTVSTILRTLP